jgi:hypothetical protein
MKEFILGMAGVSIGAILQLFVDHCRHRRETKRQEALDSKRKDLLKIALENPPDNIEWRKLTTLSQIVGADFETTTRLLIELGARGSDSEKNVWALISKKPLRGES